MNKKRKYTLAVILLVIGCITNFFIVKHLKLEPTQTVKLSIEVESKDGDSYQLFLQDGKEWNSEKSLIKDYITPPNPQVLFYDMPIGSQKVRLDLGTIPNKITIRNIEVQYHNSKINLLKELKQNIEFKNEIGEINYLKDRLEINAIGRDPYIVFSINSINSLIKKVETLNLVYRILVCLIIDIFLSSLFIVKNKIKTLCTEVYNNRTLICKLAKNDFKTKYAGSYLGIIWAFIQPLVTILIYWFVFQVGFKSAPVNDFPFVLWLIAGIIPWFVFSEAISNAAYSMLEYNYLVKKVVFKISVLPIVKVISVFFIHVFFVIFSICVFMGYGYMPNLYTLQIIYYAICMFVLVLGISYATSAIIIFFKDLGQIINIFLQVAMWMTPILWSYDIISPKYQWIFKLNPMYYIVEGYRDSFITHVWFWEKLNQTLYFWAVAIIVFILGGAIFKKLKVHFADVL